MAASIVVVADDLTGAADTGAGFWTAGLETLVTWTGASFDAALGSSADVVAVDARTRAGDASEAAAITADLVTRARTAGARTLYKKGDSTLRGHLGVEIRACLDSWFPGAVALVAMAFPATGRATVNGALTIQGARATGPTIPHLLEASDIRAASIALEDVRGSALADVFRARSLEGFRAIVCDAETDADLAAIVRAGASLPQVVWAGSGGLARALAAGIEVMARGCGARTPIRADALVSWPIVIVVGSMSPHSRVQAERLMAEGVARVQVAPAMLDARDVRACDDVVERVAGALGTGTDVLVTIDNGALDGGERPELMARLGELLRPCADRAKGAILTGGDSAVGVLRAWGVDALRLDGEVEPGVPMSTSAGRWERRVVTKAGAFGSPDTLVRARAALRAVAVAQREHA